MTSSQYQTRVVGCKYATEEEARLANIEKTKQRYRQNKDNYNEYQKEQQRKMREQKKKYEQISSNPLYPYMEQIMFNPQCYQQFVNYINLINDPCLYQQFINYLNSNNQSS
jgi:hypothetical protein